MMAEQLLSTADEVQWSTFLPANTTVFGSLGFARIGQTYLNRVSKLFVVQDEDGWIAHPMVFRSLQALPFAPPPGACWDISSPEYTGPFRFGTPQINAAAYQQYLSALAMGSGIVCAFAHMNPWSEGDRLLRDAMAKDREIVWVDATETPEVLWQQHLSHACRKNISKAERSGLRIVEVDSDEDVARFFDLYTATMVRNEALDAYRFSYDYFQAFRRELPHNSRMTLVVLGGQAIGALLVLYDADSAYSYLGGTDIDSQHLRPANLSTWDLICWAHRTGKKRVVLGAGYRPDDGILRFKASFSPLRANFHVYRKVHREEDYAALERACRDHYQLNDAVLSYFPSYRYAKPK